VSDLPDTWIAEYLNVPLPELEEKREHIRSLATF
jgi:hypothetical protein